MSRIHVPISLRWSDIDAYGHVNNAEMLRLLEEARIQVFWADESAPAPASSLVLAGGPGAATHTLIAAQQIEYLAPAPFQRRPLDVQLWIGRLGGASIEICYEVWSPREVDAADTVAQTLYARAATTLVLVDAQTGRPQRLSAEQREAWSAHLDDPVTFRSR